MLLFLPTLTPGLYGGCAEAGQEARRAGLERCSGPRWPGSSCSSGDRRGCQRATEAPGSSLEPPAHSHPAAFFHSLECAVLLSLEKRRTEVKTEEFTPVSPRPPHPVCHRNKHTYRRSSPRFDLRYTSHRPQTGGWTQTAILWPYFPRTDACHV